MNNDYLVNSIAKICNDSIKTILDDISATYKINKSDLYLKYLNNSSEKIEINKNLCMAKKQDLKQCTRKKKNGYDFCGKHINNQKYGRIDDKPIEESSDYIVTNKETFEEGDYYVDANNIVYDIIDNTPTIIGKKQDNKLLTLGQITAQ